MTIDMQNGGKVNLAFFGKVKKRRITLHIGNLFWHGENKGEEKENGPLWIRQLTKELHRCALQFLC